MTRYVEVRLTVQQAQQLVKLMAWVEYDYGSKNEKVRDRAVQKLRDALAQEASNTNR